MAYDAGRQVTVLFGGSLITGPVGDTWEYSPPCSSGDFNADGAVTLSDDLPVFVSMLLSSAGTCVADLNHDGFVDGRDISLFVTALLGP
jgi:hypothetical protein